MRRKQITPLLFIVLVAAVAVGVVFGTGTTPQLGLDLQGGVSVVLKPTKEVSNDALDQTLEIIRNRVDALGVAEPDIARQGSSVIVQLPGVKNQQRALELVGDTAELRFRPVLSVLPGSIDDLLNQSSSTTSSTVAGEETTSSTEAPSSTVAGQSAGRPATLFQDGSTTTAPTDTTVAGESTDTTVPADGSAGGLAYTDRDHDIADQPVVLPERDRKDKDKIVATYQLGPTAATGRIVSGATAQLDNNGAWSVHLEIRGGDAIDQFNSIAALCNGQDPTICPSGQLAIVLDSEVVSAPTISQASYQRDQIQISGSFDQREAKDLALVLRYGSLPVNLEPQTVQTVSASLGKDSLHAGLWAGLLGLGLVILYMLVYYRSLGLVVALGLVVWSALNYAIICWLGQSRGLALSLSGVTGLVVSVGVTVDSYVVYFERLKDEVSAGRPLTASTDRAFKRSWSTILAANATSLIGAAVLYWLTVGPVRGFAFTLGLATALDVVVAWFFIRPVVGLFAQNGFLARSPRFGIMRGLLGKAGTIEDPEASAAARRRSIFARLYHGETSADFVGRFRTWVLVSAIVILVGGVSFAVRGLNLGIDFEGGTVWEVPQHGISVEDAQGLVEDAGLKGVTVQTLESNGEVNLRIKAESVESGKAQEVSQLLAERSKVDTDEVSLTSVGPSWGDEISRKALRALIVFLILITVYITFRFELRMAIPTVAALLHDVLVTVGVYSIFGFQVTPATVIAILTILGFSIYDGIVVFDKVKENTNLVGTREDLTYGEMVDKSLNTVLMRSLNTSITALLPVASLLLLGSFVLGATTLEEFALALLIGLFAGAYSSIFIASPMLAWLKDRESRYREINERIHAKRGSTAMRHVGGRGAVADVPASSSPRAQRRAERQAEQAVAVLDRDEVPDARSDAAPGPAADPAPGPASTPTASPAAAAGERVIPPKPRKKKRR
jgi:protein-export membrane protein SecD/preprotein translocase SecF subunit